MKIDIKNVVFNLGKIANNDIYFPDYVNTYLERYITFLKDNRVDNDIINLIITFKRKIYTCLIEYYCGQHSQAKSYFIEAINYIDLKDLIVLLKDNHFYRIRTPSKNLLSKEEMFHIQFQERYKVSTQRFSYPGLPCLYLGSSFEVCCEEKDCWDKKTNIAYIEKSDSTKIWILDLYFFENFDFQNLSEKDYEKFIKLWPLVACCSFVYENPKQMVFRPDYIIPQLLLEYLIDKNSDVDVTGTGTKVCGIKYHSVKKNLFGKNDKKPLISYINYVFPATTVKPNGFCNILKSQFNVKWIRFLSELSKP